MSTVTTLDDYAHELLTHTNNALATTYGGAITRAFVSPGMPALDCCDQLTVDVRSPAVEVTAPISPLPTGGHRIGGPQGFLILVTFMVTIARCVPVAEQNQLPNVTAMQTAARVINEDVWAVWNALTTLKRTGQLFNGKCPALYLDPPGQLVPSGGCAGWVIPVRPAVDGYEILVS